MLREVCCLRNPLIIKGGAKGIAPSFANLLALLQAALSGLGYPLGNFRIVHRAAHLALPKLKICLGEFVDVRFVSHG